ncbi:MAG TPA: hypothetical protein VN922_03550 [Bacteroidia bacterium]|nr:hypothetical protein [Bacteroidia bacterium]
MKDQSLRVSAITECLEKGDSVASIIQTFTKQWLVSERTVRTCIALAKENISERNKTKAAIIEEVRKEAIAKAAKEQVMSDLEIEGVLCSIVKGEYMLEEQKIIDGTMQTVKRKPTHYDVILAADKLWKKRGSYPVEKQHPENQTLILQYNLQKPEDAKYIEGV